MGTITKITETGGPLLETLEYLLQEARAGRLRNLIYVMRDDSTAEIGTFGIYRDDPEILAADANRIVFRAHDMLLRQPRKRRAKSAQIIEIKRHMLDKAGACKPGEDAP